MFGRDFIKQFSKTYLLLSLFLLLVLPSQITFAQDRPDPDNPLISESCLKLIMAGGSKISVQLGKVISLELNQNGVCNVLRFVPPKRATRILLQGEVDGEIGRVSFYKDTVKHLAVMVPTPLLHYKGFLFTKDKSIETVAEVQGGLGVVRGWLWMKKVSQNNPEVTVDEVDTIETLVKLLENDRIQAILLPDVYEGIAELSAKYHNFKVLDITVHIWLRSRNIGQVDKVDKIIADFINAGGFF